MLYHPVGGDIPDFALDRSDEWPAPHPLPELSGFTRKEITAFSTACIDVAGGDDSALARYLDGFALLPRWDSLLTAIEHVVPLCGGVWWLDRMHRNAHRAVVDNWFLGDRDSHSVRGLFERLRQEQAALLRCLPRKSTLRLTREEANGLVIQYLRQHPGATQREVAQAIGCSQGLVGKTPRWKEVAESRRKPTRPKAVELSDYMLETLVREQEVDDRSPCVYRHV